MNTTRNGKIARLPRSVREELNRRLDNDESGRRLVAWLNTLPEVQAVVATEFGGRLIREQNLSEWKQGGYLDWLARLEALEVAGRLGEDTAELQAKAQTPLTDTLALWLAARYAVATRRLAGTDAAEDWRRLRELCADIVELRRGDHQAARLRIEQERLRLEVEAEREKTEEEFWAWAMKVENRDRICEGHLCREEREQRLREIFKLGPDEPANFLGLQGSSTAEKS